MDDNLTRDGAPAATSVTTDIGPATDPYAELERLRRELAAAEELARNLEIALQNSRQIGAAIGIVMTQRRVTLEAAFELLRTASQRTQRKLRDVAADVLYTGTLDDAPEPSRRDAKPA